MSFANNLDMMQVKVHCHLMLLKTHNNYTKNNIVAPRNYTTISQFGSGSRPFVYQLTNCFGWERNITACTLSQQFNCSQSQAAGLTCRDGTVIAYLATHE